MNRIFDVLGILAIITGIFVLSRPNSKGPALITAFGHSWANITQAASGQRLTK